MTDLTDKELHVLLMLADGSTVAEIGLELSRSKCTVKHHVVNLKRKLGAKNIAHAVALAYHEGILVPR